MFTLIAWAAFFGAINWLTRDWGDRTHYEQRKTSHKYDLYKPPHP